MSTPDIPDDLKPYVEELRQEAAKYRTKFAPYRDAFDGYDEREVSFLLTLVEQLKAPDPSQAAKVMRDMAYDMLGESWAEDAPWAEAEIPAEEPEEEETEDMTDAPTTEPGAITPEEFQRILDERDARAKQEQEQAELEKLVEQVKAEAQALGYEPESSDYFLLVNTAMHKTDGDLSKAAELIAPITGIGSATTEDTQPGAEGQTATPSAPRFPPPVQGGAGAAPGEAKEGPKNVKEARAAMEEWLSGQGNAPFAD